MKITVNVMKTDINRGKPGDCRFCPVALALYRVLVDGLIVNAGPYFITIYDPRINKEFQLNTPYEAKRFMHMFDDDKWRKTNQMNPFEFEMAFPARLVK